MRAGDVEIEEDVERMVPVLKGLVVIAGRICEGVWRGMVGDAGWRMGRLAR